jgi:hypothetical protein
MPRGGKRLGAGRKPGSVSQATKDYRDLAREYSPSAMAELARLATHAESEAARIPACKEILDRAWQSSCRRKPHCREGVEPSRQTQRFPALRTPENNEGVPLGRRSKSCQGGFARERIGVTGYRTQLKNIRASHIHCLGFFRQQRLTDAGPQDLDVALFPAKLVGGVVAFFCSISHFLCLLRSRPDRSSVISTLLVFEIKFIDIVQSRLKREFRYGRYHHATTSTLGAVRVARHRQRRKVGLRCLTIELRESEIDALIQSRRLAPDARGELSAVRKALYAFLDDTLR